MSSLNSPQSDESNDQVSSDLGKELAALLRQYGDPADSDRQAEIAQRIKSAVAMKDKDALLREIAFFGHAHFSVPGQHAGMAQLTEWTRFFCAKECSEFSRKLQALPEMPWNKLATALGIPTRAFVKSPEKPSETQLSNAETFITEFVLYNDGLTGPAKELLVDKARAEIGPWSVAEYVSCVTQEGRKITIHFKSGEACEYLPEEKVI